MKYPGSTQAIAAFAIPPHPPQTVAEAKTQFDAVADKLGTVMGELHDAQDALAAAEQADLRHHREHGQTSPTAWPSPAKQRRAEALIEDLRGCGSGGWTSRWTRRVGPVALSAIAGTAATSGSPLWRGRDSGSGPSSLTVRSQQQGERSTKLDLLAARCSESTLFNLDLARTRRQSQYAVGRLRVKRNTGQAQGQPRPRRPTQPRAATRF